MKFYNLDNADNKIDSTASENEVLGIVDYGEKNEFPAKLLNEIEYSPTSKRCLDKIFRFVLGQGFVNEKLNNLSINKEETLYDLLRSHAMDVSFFEGLYTQVQYSMNAKKANFYHTPFEVARVGEISDRGTIRTFKTNKLWGSLGHGYDEEFVKTFYSFNDNEDVVREQIINTEGGVSNYNGQILYSHIKRPQKQIYPAPQYYSAINWIGVDAKIGNFHYNNLDKNFLLSCIIDMIGDPTEPEMRTKKNKEGDTIEEPTGRTLGDVFNEMMKENFGGTKSGGTALVTWSQDGENRPEVKPFPSNTNEKLFTTLQELTTENLLMAFDVQPSIANIKTAGKLGNSQEILNAFDIMNANTEPYRALIEDHYKKLFRNHQELKNESFEIKPLEYALKPINNVTTN